MEIESIDFIMVMHLFIFKYNYHFGEIRKFLNMLE